MSDSTLISKLMKSFLSPKKLILIKIKINFTIFTLILHYIDSRSFYIKKKLYCEKPLYMSGLPWISKLEDFLSPDSLFQQEQQ